LTHAAVAGHGQSTIRVHFLTRVVDSDAVIGEVRNAISIGVLGVNAVRVGGEGVTIVRIARLTSATSPRLLVGIVNERTVVNAVRDSIPVSV
jgi:hypothetical protein